MLVAEGAGMEAMPDGKPSGTEALTKLTRVGGRLEDSQRTI